MINVVSKTCEYDGCIKQPCYNISGEKKGRFCANHKELNMVDVINRKCEIIGCNEDEIETNFDFLSQYENINFNSRMLKDIL